MPKILAENVPQEQMHKLVDIVSHSERFVMVEGKVLISQEIIKPGHPFSLGKPIRVIGGIWYDGVDLRNEYAKFLENFPKDCHKEFEEMVYFVIPKPTS